ncbi:hypothetical protein [Streptomyces sp. NPDC001480]|uniref:hypothetical protein n=1 Tax=Streptomyces sp. NPDC001480 TaxID=3364577 RepID=UPI00368432F2
MSASDCTVPNPPLTVQPRERIATKTTAYYRALDEGATLRHHFRHADEEGGLWYIEAVPTVGDG